MCFRPRSQCPAVGLAGLKEAAGTGGHRCIQDGWLQRPKLTVCEKSSSQVLHLPSISLLTRQETSVTIVATFRLSLFTYKHTEAEKQSKEAVVSSRRAETNPRPSRETKPRNKYNTISIFQKASQAAVNHDRTRKQMPSLIMQANVHCLARAMASHRHHIHRAYGAV